jgi:hypothetical protein
MGEGNSMRVGDEVLLLTWRYGNSCSFGVFF